MYQDVMTFVKMWTWDRQLAKQLTHRKINHAMAMQHQVRITLLGFT